MPVVLPTPGGMGTSALKGASKQLVQHPQLALSKSSHHLRGEDDDGDIDTKMGNKSLLLPNLIWSPLTELFFSHF